MDSATVSSRLATLQGQLSDMARAMMLAQKVGDSAALEAFRPQYRLLAAEAKRLREEVNRSEAPSTLLLQLDTFGDNVIEVGRQLGEVPAGIGAAFRSLPVIIGGLAVLGLLAAWVHLRQRK